MDTAIGSVEPLPDRFVVAERILTIAWVRLSPRGRIPMMPAGRSD
jgi:hypothetical protein